MTKKKRSHDDKQWDRTSNEETGNSSNIWRRTLCSPSPYPMGGIWTDMEVPAPCLLSSKRVVFIGATPSV